MNHAPKATVVRIHAGRSSWTSPDRATLTDGKQRETVEGPARRQLPDGVRCWTEERIHGVHRQARHGREQEEVRGLAVPEDLALYRFARHRFTVNFAVTGIDLPPEVVATAVAL